MPGILYVVATPIGNLEDVTLRALRTLREVSLIAAEDTRRTSRLLQHYSIPTRTTSLHEHNERAKAPSLIQRMLAGESIALVSDAGTPGVSDPGSYLVAAAHAAGIRVEAIPGASALLTAVAASGLVEREFVFVGFPPPRSNARKKWLEAMVAEPRTWVMYEAPHRISATLSDMLEILGDRVVAVGRELTKAHESLVVQPISGHLDTNLVERGEFVLVVTGSKDQIKPHGAVPGPTAMADEFGRMTNIDGLSRREALKALSVKYGIPAREIFNALEKAKHGFA